MGYSARHIADAVSAGVKAVLDLDRSITAALEVFTPPQLRVLAAIRDSPRPMSLFVAQSVELERAVDELARSGWVTRDQDASGVENIARSAHATQVLGHAEHRRATRLDELLSSLDDADQRRIADGLDLLARAITRGDRNTNR